MAENTVCTVCTVYNFTVNYRPQTSLKKLAFVQRSSCVVKVWLSILASLAFSGVVCVILRLSVLNTISACDGQTDTR